MMTIFVDTREKPSHAYTFTSIGKSFVEFDVVRQKLDTGDYMTVRNGHCPQDVEACAIVERKSLSDLYQTLTQGRDRFNRELQRMEEYGYRAIVIESQWVEIINPNRFLPHPTKASPRSIVSSLLAWSQRHAVHIFPCPGAMAAEKFTFRILERWYRDGNKKCGDQNVQGTFSKRPGSRTSDS